MRKILIAILLLLGALRVCTAANTLQLSSTQGHPGDTVTFTLSMNNSDAVVALQTMIPLGSQLTFVPGSCILTARGSQHQATAIVLRDTLRIYSYSLSLAPYSGNSGDLLSFKVVLGKEPGNYALPLCRTLLSSAMGGSLNVSTNAGAVTILAPKIAISTGSINYGHIPIRSTYTQNVTVSNIGTEPLVLSGISFNNGTLSATGVAQTIAAGSQTTLSIQYAPLVAGAVSYQAIVHSNARVGDSVIAILADPFAVNELRPLPASGETDSTVTVSLRMNNMDSIVGLQTGIILPAALTYVPGSFTMAAERSQGHLATAGMIGDTLVMLITNLNNRPLRGGDGVVASFQLKLHGYGYYPLQLIQTALSDATGQNVLSAVYSDGVQIYSPSLNCNGALNFGNTPVTETANASLQVNNHGNATLLIQQVVFTDANFTFVTPLPMSVSAWQNGTLAVAYTGTQEGMHTATMNIYSNDPFHPLVQVNLTASRYEPNYLSVSADADVSVENAAVDINLDNYSTITAIQMDVVYPKNHYSMTANDIHLTGRSNGHVVSAAALNDSTLRVLILSMQNQSFSGNSGAVAHINLHAVDPTDEGHYPLRLNNVLTGGPDGLDRLTSYDSVVYIATRTVHDTTYIPVHDTTYVDVHDTTYIDVHDTTYVDVPYPVHDTTYVDVFVPVHDTTYIDVHDTTYVDVPYPVHDTTYVDVFVPVHDTTYINVHDTTYVDVPYPVHDTTYVDVFVPVHDTTYIDVHDTTYVDVFVPVHDTTYIDVPYPVHDTTYVNVYVTIHDTAYVDVPYPVHDTTYITLYDTTYIVIHDTVTVTEQLTWFTLQVASDNPGMGVAAGSGQFPDGTEVEIAAIPIEGNRFLQWSDGSTVNPRTVTVSNDILIIAQFETVGVENHLSPTWYVCPEQGGLIIKGAGGHNVKVYSETGRLLHHYSNALDLFHYNVPSSGVYLIQLDNGAARKVTVIR